jgi:hypothetical protein
MSMMMVVMRLGDGTIRFDVRSPLISIFTATKISIMIIAFLIACTAQN